MDVYDVKTEYAFGNASTLAHHVAQDKERWVREESQHKQDHRKGVQVLDLGVLPKNQHI